MPGAGLAGHRCYEILGLGALQAREVTLRRPPHQRCDHIQLVVPSFPLRENGVWLAENMQLGPWIPVGIQLQKAALGPTSGPTLRVSHSAGGDSSAKPFGRWPARGSR